MVPTIITEYIAEESTLKFIAFLMLPRQVSCLWLTDLEYSVSYHVWTHSEMYIRNNNLDIQQ